jgi:hypothetical protein
VILPAPSFLPIVGESGPARVVRIVRAFAGCSLHVRRAELAALVGRGVDDESVVAWETNCCTFALGVLFAAGVDFPALRIPLVNGAEFGILVSLGYHFGAWRTVVPSEIPPAGAAVWYRTPTPPGGKPKNDDHVEFALDGLDEHGGGGRPDNAIEIQRGNVHVSAGRPLYRWLDPNALGLPDAIASAPDPAPPPTEDGAA